MNEEICTGFCTSQTAATVSTVSVASGGTENSAYPLPADALTNEAFLSAFFLPLAFYFLGLSKGIILKLIKEI